MSTGCECEHIEVAPGKWYYLLEHTHAPKNSWDWREHASCWGPFDSYELSHAHQTSNHANPGGHSIHHWAQGFEPDEVLAALIAEARR